MKRIIIISFVIILFTAVPFSRGSSDIHRTVQDLFDSQFDDHIAQLMQKGHVPSLSACVVFDGELSWAKGYGEQPKTDLANDIGSITKTFTATALLQLYEQNVFDLDEDVNRYLPFELRNRTFRIGKTWTCRPTDSKLLQLTQSKVIQPLVTGVPSG
ncbi:MAG: serine hydrolase domain-containing protein, partial [Candidatus Hodarchaeales archaeon]